MPCVSVRHIFAVRKSRRLQRSAVSVGPDTPTPAATPVTHVAPTASSTVTTPVSQPAPSLAQNQLPGAIFTPNTAPLSWGKSRRITHADLINAESRLGSTIFGPIPAGHRREFFHDHGNIWIWHEDWYDFTLKNHKLTVRYEVRKSGVYKKVRAGEYFKLEGDELENFRKAAYVYLYTIKTGLYQTA